MSVRTRREHEQADARADVSVARAPSSVARVREGGEGALLRRSEVCTCGCAGMRGSDTEQAQTRRWALDARVDQAEWNTWWMTRWPTLRSVKKQH